MKKVLLAISSLFCLVILAAPVAVLAADEPETSAPPPSAAQQAVCEGVGLVGGGSGCAPAPGQSDLKSVIATGINILSLIVGIVAVVMIMIGGFKYITSSGDSAKVNSAKDTILYAIIGVVVASLAQVIVRFVLTKT